MSCLCYYKATTPLPKNTTSVLQPLDVGVMGSTVPPGCALKMIRVRRFLLAPDTPGGRRHDRNAACQAL
eukprot:jgi/Phyca11/114383/e_gw1.26.490.1